MSEDFDSGYHSGLSPLWPVLILVLGLLVWFGSEDYQLNGRRAYLQTQLEKVQPTLKDGEKLKGMYRAIISDVVVTAQKDPAAQQIVKDAISAGLFRVKPGGTPGTPASSDPSSFSGSPLPK